MPTILLQILTDRKQLNIFILGIYSGMPIFIIYSTLAAWLKTNNIDLGLITSLAAARVFYSLKFLWAPLFDQVRVPFLGNMGRRKSWMMILVTILAAIIFTIGLMDPANDFSKIFLLTILLAFTSASLDIVIDAYRIDIIEKSQLSIAAANAVFGYRIGGLIAVAGAFYVAEEYGWNIVFKFISFLYLISILFISKLAEEDKKIISNKIDFNLIKKSFFEPLAEFFKRDYSVTILVAIICYKLGDAMLGVVANPFYMELGFSLKEIAAISKLYGLIATIFGAYSGGIIVAKYGNLKGLIICGIAQSLTNFAYVWLCGQGHDVASLIITISVENVAAGMGDAALVGYLSYLCNKSFSASQYALLSSASGLYSHSIVGFGGSLVKLMGWQIYFTMTVFLAAPGLILLVYLNKKLKKN